MNCINYQMNLEKRARSPRSPCHHRCDEIMCANKEKDLIISQLKANIFELELREKDYNILNDKVHQLQYEIAKLNDCKLQLECEKKMKDDCFNKSLCELKGENENLQLSFNEKLKYNKNIYSENNTLGKQIECKDEEICELKLKLNDLSFQLQKNDEDVNNLQKIVENLTDIKASQNTKISQLIEDNKTLKRVCHDQDCCLKGLAKDRALLTKNHENKNNEIINLNCQAKKNAAEQCDLQNELNKCNAMNAQLQENVKDSRAELDGLKCQNENLNDNLIKEKSNRVSENQKNNKLNNILNDREKKIEMINLDINSIKRLQKGASDTNCVLQDENEKLRNHILVLTDLNQVLINEIDNVINEDAKMRNILDRKERINSVLMNNRCNIDQSLNDLDQYINRGSYINCRTPCNHL